MPQILRTVLIDDETVAADGSATYDLPVNPLSAILLTVKALNSTAAQNDYSWAQALLNMITNLRVSYRGATIVDGSLTDLAVLMAALTGWQARQFNSEAADNQVRGLTVPIVFGRRPYDINECFPATRRGDLVLSLTRDIAVTGADGLVLQAETIELLDADPQAFIKVTTQSPVAFAAGNNFVELPIGNQLLGALLRGFNVPDAADYQASFGQVAMLVDNVEVAYSTTNWETLHNELGRRLPAFYLESHTHTFLGVAAAAEGLTRQQNEEGSLLENYALLDLDPNRDLMFALDTAGAAQVRLRVASDAADATQSRVLPIEYVKTTAGRAAG